MSDPRQKKLATKALAKVVDYKRTFNTQHGARVLYDLMDQHYMMKPMDVGNPQVHAFQEGQRAVVLRLLTLLKIDPMQLQERIKEADEYSNAD